MIFRGWLGASVGGYVALILLLLVANVWLVAHEIMKNDGRSEVLGLMTSEAFIDSVKLTFFETAVVDISVFKSQFSLALSIMI